MLMQNADYKPIKILEFIRSGLIEQEHYGFLIKMDSFNNVLSYGETNDYPFFLRSCAKPLQSALLIDFETDIFYNFSLEEITVCCASHAGEQCHIDLVKGILNKIGLDESYLKCGLHKPISKTEKNKLLLENKNENILQNNCSGKHAMMLAICKQNNWDTRNYELNSHPLQIAIKNKIYELCELKQEFPATKDGCGVPIYSMPLENMLKGYMNLFLSNKYCKLRQAFLNNPYIIGGEDRLDTAIMSVNNNLIAKVGAGGLCVVVNIELKEALIIKVMDCDMKARAICLIDVLKQFGWLDANMLNNALIKKQYDKDIYTLHNEKIGEVFCFKVLS